MLALLATADRVKLGAVEALLRSAGVACEVFDTAAGALWARIIPLRLMIADEDAGRARRVLREAGFVEAGDGEWDLRERSRA